MTSSPYTLHKTNAYPLGSSYTERGVRFSLECGSGDCGVLMYPAGSGAPVKIPFPSWSREGRLMSMEVRFTGVDAVNRYLKDPDGRGLRYLFYAGDEIFPDPYMQDSAGFGGFGKVTSPFSRVSTDSYEHRDPFVPEPYSRSLLYMLHVRGYTAHSSSGVRDKGTFRGLIRKLPYIRTLGATGLILMPVYEFNELIYAPDILRGKDEKPAMVNFWGYTDGYYYVPKHSYSASGNPVREMHEMVDAIHEAGMEVILQFMFADGMTVREITDVLRFWRATYDVDGYQLIGGGLPIDEILQDPGYFDDEDADLTDGDAGYCLCTIDLRTMKVTPVTPGLYYYNFISYIYHDAIKTTRCKYAVTDFKRSKHRVNLLLTVPVRTYGKEIHYHCEHSNIGNKYTYSASSES